MFPQFQILHPQLQIIWPERIQRHHQHTTLIQYQQQTHVHGQYLLEAVHLKMIAVSIIIAMDMEVVNLAQVVLMKDMSVGLPAIVVIQIRVSKEHVLCEP